MTTSLAQQLNALKIAQRDALNVPQRTRISFFFDSKQAANIDDQTLYYICKSGIKQLREDGSLDLEAFEGDILNESSLKFYRGSETQETNKTIDEQVEALLKALSPFLLDQSTLKVVEYLIRIYEVHVYHKQTLILAFMPLFETVYFLRISQCLNLKDDQVWGWLHQFAYSGVSIDKQTLVKCLARQNGLVFCLCADYSLQVKGDLHNKWFGSFLSEVLKANASEGLMFGVLPFISQAMKQWESKDLRVACFLALGQLTCRRTLTSEYVSALVRQLLQTIGSKDQLEFDEDVKIKGLTTLLFFTQYQTVTFDQKHFDLFKKISKLPKFLDLLAKSYDTTSLCKVVLEGSGAVSIQIDELRPIMKALLNLKSVFLSVESLISRGCNDESSQATVKQQLELIKELQPDNFKQSIIFVLKQVSDKKIRDKMVDLLSDGSEPLMKKFGDNRDFSILSALSSNKKSNRDSALTALNEPSFIQQLNQKEAGLVHLVLLQILEHETHDQQTLTFILAALGQFTNQSSDVDFETLILLLEKISCGKLTYSSETNEQILRILSEIKVTRVCNTKIQAWLSLQSAQPVEMMYNQNPYYDLVKYCKSKQQKKSVDELFISKLSEKPQFTITLLLAVFVDKHSFYDYASIGKLLKRIGQSTQKDVLHNTVVNQLFMPILTQMKLKQFESANELMFAIAETGMIAESFNFKLAKKILGVSLIQKQFSAQSVDLNIIHKKLNNDKTKFAELMLRICVSSKCKVKRIFACQVLAAFHQKGKLAYQSSNQLCCKIMVGVVLMLLNDQDRQIRESGLLLADAVVQMQNRATKETGIEVIEVFADTEKPQSVQKRPVKLTPMKTKSVSSLLQDLVDAKNDITLDRSQLKQVLSKHAKPEVFEEILRTLLDYPTFKMKLKLIEVLTLPQKHVMIFCMNLSQVLQKLFTQIDKAEMQYCEGYLSALGALISHLQEYSAKQAQKEILTSLTLPYLKYIVEKKVLALNIYQMFDNNVLITDILKEADQRLLKEIFKVFQKSAVNQTKIKYLFVQRVTGIYKGDDLAYCLNDCINMELAMETIIQLSPPPSAKLFEQSVQILETLISKFIKDEEVAYLIELCTQVALISMPQKHQSSSQLKIIVDGANRVWDRTKVMVQKGLSQEGQKKEDPFDEFMKGDENSNEDGSEDEDEVDLLGCLQVTISILNLLTPFEQKENLDQVTHTTELLGNIADYLVQCCKTKTDSATVQSAIKSQLYHMYQSLLLRTTQRRVQNFPYSRIIVKYVQSCITLADIGTMSKQLVEGNLFINTIKNVPEYASLVFFTLLWEANKVPVTLNDQNMIVYSVEAGSALYLAHEVLLWQLDYHQDLSLIRELMYLAHNLAIVDNSRELIQSQTEILFSDFESLHLQESAEIVQKSETKERRKFIFLCCVILTQWVEKDSKALGRLASIAGTPTPTLQVQDQLLHILLSSYIMREQVSQLLVNQSSASLLRLQSSISKWQYALNEMMSLQIHVLLVMKILDMTPLALKVNTLCLLLDKFQTFSGGWLTKCTADLHRIISKLIQKCVFMLKANQTEQLAQLLLTVLSRTASSSLTKEIQQETLQVTMQYHKGSLQLQTQTVLTEMILMETYTYQMLDYFHLYLQHTLDGFTTKESLFLDTYKHALLKSLICISSIFLKFLTADQLEQVITYSIMAAAQGVITSKDGDSVQIILESISSESTNHKKLVLQATMNTYSLLTSNTNMKGFNIMTERYFLQLLAPVIRRLPQSFFSEHHQKFVTFFKSMFGLPVKAPACTPQLVECFNAFILKLNEDTLRPIIVALTKWSAKESQRKMVFFQILCGCLNTLREFFVPMVKIYFDLVAQSFVTCFEELKANKFSKRVHMAVQSSEQSFDLLVVVCRLTELNYKYDSNSFLQNDSFEVLCDPIANLFDLVHLDQYDQFVNTSIKPLILEMDERTQDDNMWQKMNYTILMKTRSEHWQTRLAVLQVIEHLFDKMRERYLVILNDTIPFVSELLEDENERVELAAKSIVNRIEQLTGESINEYLKL